MQFSLLKQFKFNCITISLFSKENNIASKTQCFLEIVCCGEMFVTSSLKKCFWHILKTISEIWKLLRLWSNYFMLKRMMNIKNRGISKYYKLVSIDQRANRQISCCVKAQNETDLMQKIAQIFGVFGACSFEERTVQYQTQKLMYINFRYYCCIIFGLL